MEIPDASFTLASAALMAVVFLALLCVQVISPLERRLVTGTALILAGIFFMTRGAEPAFALTGVVGALVGGAIAFRAAAAWNASEATRYGPVAALILLPPAIFGAILLGGAIFSFLVAPARLFLRLMGG